MSLPIQHFGAPSVVLAPGVALRPMAVGAPSDDAALGLLEHRWLHVMSFGDVSDAQTAALFSAAYRRLELQAHRFGMPDGHDDAADWTEQFLFGAAPSGLVPGTAEYRRRHISMLWSAQLWHEAIMVGAGAGAIGLLFYALARVMVP